MQPLVLIGGGGHARSVIEVIESTGVWRVYGLVDPQLVPGTDVLGYPVLGGDDVLPSVRLDVGAAHVAIGQIKSPQARIRAFATLKQLGFEVPAIIASTACVSRRSVVGEGSTIMHSAFVGPGVIVGQNTILNTRAHVEHDCQIGDHCHIATGAVLNGGVKIGHRTFVGSNSCLMQGLHIGDDCLVAMGARVTADLADGSSYFGARAK